MYTTYVIRSLKLELLEVVSHYVGARNLTQVLHKSQTCCLPLSHIVSCSKWDLMRVITSPLLLLGRSPTQWQAQFSEKGCA